MVRKIETWEAQDGQKFERYADALKHELFLLVLPIMENEALALKFVTRAAEETTVRQLCEVLPALKAELFVD